MKSHNLLSELPFPCEDAPVFAKAVAAALTAGDAAEPSCTDYRWHDEERGESDILKWRDNSYVATVQSEKKFNLLYQITLELRELDN
jgi:hypothetical protein